MEMYRGGRAFCQRALNPSSVSILISDPLESLQVFRASVIFIVFRQKLDIECFLSDEDRNLIGSEIAKDTKDRFKIIFSTSS